MKNPKKYIANWGRFPSVQAEFIEIHSVDAARRALSGRRTSIPRGLGRCYGDSSLADRILSLVPMDKFISFDETTGLLECEAGVSFKDILETFVPRGWFLPVTPGTKFITVGGAIASDVHGKNHHLAGGFTRFVKRLSLLIGDGSIVRCSPSENTDLFRATCGGMGLTGVIVTAAFTMRRIPSSFVSQETLKARDLDEIIGHFQNSSAPFSVAWIDCLARGRSLGRSVLMQGDFAEPVSLPADKPFLTVDTGSSLTFPFNAPSYLLNTTSVSVFNALYHGRFSAGASRSLIHYEPFFYPLDKILHWNRMYGSRGFLQYQCVLPLGSGHRGMRALLETISSSGQASFLAVLKLFGRQTDTDGYLSFPMEGFTLALDFPHSSSLFSLLDRLDAIVLEHGGRLYLTKDARMSAETFKKGYPHLEEFLAVKRRVDPFNIFRSLQSDRLIGEYLL